MQRNPLMKQPPKFVNEKQNNVFFQFQNKKPREHQKKQSFESKPSILSKVLFFVFLVLLEFVLKVSRFCLLFSMWPKTRMVVGIIGCMTG